MRFARGVVPVSMNKHTIWTRYYGPREFYRHFQPEFTLEYFRGLCVFAPPPYLTWVREKHAVWHERLWQFGPPCGRLADNPGHGRSLLDGDAEKMTRTDLPPRYYRESASPMPRKQPSSALATNCAPADGQMIRVPI